MNMKKSSIFAFFAACMLLATPLFSALPPLYQGVRELKAILEDNQLGELLESGELIMDIRKTNDGYMIVTNQHQLNVKVDYEKGHIGPIPFHLEFSKPTSLKDNVNY